MSSYSSYSTEKDIYGFEHPLAKTPLISHNVWYLYALFDKEDHTITQFKTMTDMNPSVHPRAYIIGPINNDDYDIQQKLYDDFKSGKFDDICFSDMVDELFHPEIKDLKQKTVKEAKNVLESLK